MVNISTMPSYQCKIGTAEGRIIEKTYDSASKNQLRMNLEEQGFHVFQIQRQSVQFFRGGQHKSTNMTGGRFLAFNQELLVLLRSGLPVLQIFDTQIEQVEAGSFRDVLCEIREEIKGGSSLSDAFANFPRFFPPLYIASLKAGEKTGDLAETLSRFLEYQKRVELIRAKVKSASFYPLLLTTAAVFVVTFLMLFVVPRFSQIYADANAELPFITKILINFSNFIGTYWYVVIIIIFIVTGLFRTLRHSSRGKLRIDRFLLRVPFVGNLKVDYALTGFNRTLGTTLASGTPLVQSMRMSCGTLNNLSLEKKMVQAISRIEEGSNLADSLTRTNFFPPLALRMVSVGETAGSLTEMLNDIADYYEAQVEQRLTKLTTMIEPIMMMFMGLIIAFIIVAMYVPIFQLAGAVG